MGCAMRNIVRTPSWGRQEAGVTEIADELEVHKSTAFRLLGVLENRGLVA
ncbi:helix-turn-helix domain-containing protein, partial [Streptomyces sp. NPDC093544]